MLIALALFCLLQVVATTKLYSGSLGYGNSKAWLDDYMPCGRDLVVFPFDYPAVLPLPADISISGFILPQQGALLLGQDASIIFDDSHETGECSSEDRRAYLKTPKTSKWFDPSSWTIPDVAKSVATTDLERVPCNDEHVVITRNNGALSFDLEKMPYFRLGQLSLAGSSISKAYLQQLLRTEVGQLLFHNAETTVVEYYRNKICGCHKDVETVSESICHNVQCDRPHCRQPIMPLGSCCPICGALMRILDLDCLESTLKATVDQIKKRIAEEDENLIVQGAYFGTEVHGRYMQIIIIEPGTYSERSTTFMRNLMAKNKTALLANKPILDLKYAGSPYNPNVSFGSVLLILFCTVLVVVVAIIMLAHYMPQNPYLNRIPQWIHDPRRWRWRNLNLGLRSNMIFARFDNAGHVGVATAGSGVERIEEHAIGYDAESGEVRERAFNNPMFEENRTAQASLAKASSSAVEAKLKVVPEVEMGELDSDSVEQQELTEINLDSSGEESDSQAETFE